MEGDDRVDREFPDGDALAHDLAVDLALDRHVDEDVALDLGDAAQPPIGRKAPVAPVIELETALWGEVLRCRFDPVLLKFPDPLFDLAATAQPVAATHGVDVDPETASGVEHCRSGWNAATTPRWREDHQGLITRMASGARFAVGRGHR